MDNDINRADYRSVCIILGVASPSLLSKGYKSGCGIIRDSIPTQYCNMCKYGIPPDYKVQHGGKDVDTPSAAPPDHPHAALDDLIRDLRRLRVETGSLVCLGCGHEHNCPIHGCAIINKAIAVLETCAGLLSGRKEVSDCQDPNNAAK